MKRMSVDEAARKLAISKEAAYKRVQRGTLPSTKGLDGRVYVYLDAAEETEKEVEPTVISGYDPEISKLCFEYFKHFTTISTATALLEMALYRQLALNKSSAIVGVSLLGLTLIMCIMGLVPLTIGATIRGKFSQVGTGVKLLMGGTAGTFLCGVLIFTLASFSPYIDNLIYLALKIFTDVSHWMYDTARSFAEHIR